MAVTVKRGGGRRAPTDGGAVATPSQQIIAGAAGSVTVTTAGGTVLGIRKLTSFNEMQLSRAVGRDSGNEQYMLWCVMAAAVSSIDGDALPMPSTALECEAIIQRIGDDGVSALQLYAVRVSADAKNARAVEDLRDTVGKS